MKIWFYRPLRFQWIARGTILVEFDGGTCTHNPMVLMNELEVLEMLGSL